MHLDHITTRTRDLPGTKAFFLKVFDDLEERERPKAIHRIPGHWLYADDKPIVYPIGSNGRGLDGAAEAFGHIGIHLDGYKSFRGKLETLGIPYSKKDLPELDERRLFFRTPSGPLLEAVFHEPISNPEEHPMTNTLFTSHPFGRTTLPNRVAMAPMTRSRTTQPGNVPNVMMAEYYAQRASAGLIITEATQISQQGQGYSFTPGIYTPDQIEGWKLVTEAVHRKGGRIFLQLWHVGRMSHESFHGDGKPVAPSALSPDAQVWVIDSETGEGGMVDAPTPRALKTNEITAIVFDFRKAAANAIEAGFDGVEIHGANGYLIDEFLRRSSNHRADEYGGSHENRIRFLVEVAEAVADEIGADRTGVRMSPYITQRNMADDEIIEVMLKAARELDRIGLVYIHLSEADWDDAPTIPEQFRYDLRAAYCGAIIVAGKYTKERGQDIIAKGLADIVAYGRPFIANPDLPYRYANNLPLADFDGSTLFGGTAEGYSDYSALADAS